MPSDAGPMAKQNATAVRGTRAIGARKHEAPGGRSRRASVIAAVGLAIAVGACAEARLVSHGVKLGSDGAPAGEYKVGKPYKVDGVWYYPQVDSRYDETGVASWYGEPFHGRRTANGERFDMNSISAAHKTLPMPSFVRVTNLENGRSMVVRVNDRGPFVHGRIIDVSRRTAQLLGFEKNGTAPVRVQIVGGPGETFIASKPATAPEERTAAAAAPPVAVTSTALPPPTGAATAPRTVTGRVPVTIAGRDTQAIVDARVTTVPVPPTTSLYVQAGSFLDPNNAYRLRSRLNGVVDAHVSSAIVGGRQFYRVRVGPIASLDQADAALEQVIAMGQGGARIVVD